MARPKHKEGEKSLAQFVVVGCCCWLLLLLLVVVVGGGGVSVYARNDDVCDVFS